MALYFTDVFSGSADWIVTDPHAQGTIVKASQGTGYVNPKYEYQYSLAKTNGRLLGLYHYAGGNDPVAEATYFLDHIRGKVGEAVLAAALELAPYNIRVNSVHPGVVETPMIKQNDNSDEVKAFAKTIPLQRIAKPEDVSQMVAFLASDEADYSTGSEFIVDGGLTAK
ncbi:SDR family oxidoreductase [Limosilactobacillus portuensis]|uniref:SDR family oxidoreductase n=1 Tax=Limosilactobacillus portuensis TaxID=2742601 RepID=UPI002359CE63|nr:SDR family oxidoreductase [Limosilactobacillus portuensis]WCT61513.1 SDR family oxidoreductase [Limosilactobacillus portuensis]